MGPEAQISSISHVIQFAIAPVFLLTAVGTMIGVLASRLARIVDRSRLLEERLPQLPGAERQALHRELSTLSRRMRQIYLAIVLDVICALGVGVLIAVAFIDAFLRINLAKLIAVLFVVAMIAFIASLLAFLREIFLAVASTRAGMPVKDARKDTA